MKCTGEPVKSFSVHDFFLKQDEADVYWHVYSLLALREKSWTEKLFTGSPVHFTVPISPVGPNYCLGLLKTLCKIFLKNIQTPDDMEVAACFRLMTNKRQINIKHNGRLFRIETKPHT